MRYKLYYPPGFLLPNGSERICNGCGSGWNAILVPDNLLGLEIRIACCIHDYMYEVGITIKDKAFADKMFLYNMKMLIYNESCLILRPTRLSMARTYYHFVCKFGSSAFFEGKK